MTQRETEQIVANAVFAALPAYAAAFTKITGKTWVVADDASPVDDMEYPRFWFALCQPDTGLVLGLHAEQRDNRVTCSPTMPNLPDGTAHPGLSGWRDFGLRDVADRRIERPEAGVALDRFSTDVEACARRFAKVVALPCLALWPRVQAVIRDYAESYAIRDRVAAELAAKFDGHMRNDGHSINVSLGRGLPRFTVAQYGHIRFGYTPTLSLYTATAYCNALLSEKSAGTDAAA